MLLHIPKHGVPLVRCVPPPGWAALPRELPAAAVLMMHPVCMGRAGKPFGATPTGHVAYRRCRAWAARRWGRFVARQVVGPGPRKQEAARAASAPACPPLSGTQPAWHVLGHGPSVLFCL